MSIPVRDALSVLANTRDDRTVIITHQGSARVWPLLSEHPLDFHYNPSTMGGAVPFGLGLALARPDLEVVVLTGDGSLAMNLGSLITVVAAAADNVTVVVLDNGLYEVTGGQAVATRLADVQFDGLAASVGFPTAVTFDALELWQAEAESLLKARGPRMISLRVDPAKPQDLTTQLPPITERIEQFSCTVQKLPPNRG